MKELQPLRDLVGSERSVRSVCQTLHLVVSGMSPPTVGAMHVTCADESEHECAAAFQQGFAQYVLPDLKVSQSVPFRLANLGGRYEWGAIRVAESHYATEASRKGWKLLVVQVNAHVAVQDDGGELRYGKLMRYGEEDACCGALTAVIGGAATPFAAPLRDAFASDDRDRLAVLRDANQVHPNERMLRAALASTRLQARAVMLDIQDHRVASPTLYLVLPCVTVNRPGPDSEVLCGLYLADHRGDDHREEYYGLGDDPAAYELEMRHERLHVTEASLHDGRLARDHRDLALSHWQTRAQASKGAVDERIERIRRDVEQGKHTQHNHGRWLLSSLLVALAELAPIPAAILLFGHGAIGIHHAFRVHRLMGELGDSREAQTILHEIHDRVQHLDPAEAQALLELLLKECRGA